MKFPIFSIVACVCSLGLGNLTATTPQPIPELSYDNGIWDLDWDTVAGRTYFIQYSFDAQSWHYFSSDLDGARAIVTGDGTPLGFSFTAYNLEKYFLRLKYTDQPVVGDPGDDDFDNDGYTNEMEIASGSDPFVFTNGPANPGTPQNPGGGNPPTYPDYPLSPLDPDFYLVVYRLNVDTIGAQATSPTPPVRAQYALDKDFKILALNGSKHDPEGKSPGWAVIIPSGDVKVDVSLKATLPSSYSRNLNLLLSQEQSDSSPSGTKISHGNLGLVIPPNVVDSNVAKFTEFLGTIASRDISAVVLKVDDTNKPQDDLIAVSLGTDDDLATDFSVRVSGRSGLKAHLSVKGTDGGVKFKDAILTLANGVENPTKLWGTSESSARDSSNVEVTLKENGLPLLKEDGTPISAFEEDVTVFKGVEMIISGNFYINVDTREFLRRPWDGRTDPKPNTKRNLTGENHIGSVFPAPQTAAQVSFYKKITDQSESFGYESAISFKDGDNPKIPSYKPWKDTLKVEVTEVYSKLPPFRIDGDPIVGAILEMEEGYLEGPDQQELLKDPKIKVGDYVILDNTTSNTPISSNTIVTPQPITTAQVKAQIAAAKGNAHDELLNFMDFKAGSLAGFSGYVYDWKNDTFGVVKGSEIKESAAAKSLKGEKELGTNVEAKWKFTRWNEFKFQGDLKDAKIETK